jgi:N-acetyl-anhydromuramyl-L-alanine amidase AmpD
MYASAQDNNYYLNLKNNLEKISSFVFNGGLLIAHSCDWGWDGTGGWQGFSILPGGVTHLTLWEDWKYISQSIHITEPEHGVVKSDEFTLTDAYLSGWGYSTHGIFTNLLPGTTVVMVSNEGDGGDGPTYIDYDYGAGKVLATMQTVEWGYFNGSRGWVGDRPEFLRNEIRFALKWEAPAGKPPVVWKAAHPNNYREANRGKDDIQYIVIHVAQGYYQGTVDWFAQPNPASASAHYVISNTGEITQMVKDKDVAYHVGDGAYGFYNSHSIGIEHEGWTSPEVEPPLSTKWWSETGGFSKEMYEKSASLVRWLCEQYDIPKDRIHIIGHSEIWPKLDPGKYWDWNYYMDLVRGTKGFTLTTYSPVDMIVTDPDGLIISKQTNEIPGAVYIEVDIDGDGIPDDQVNIAERKPGDYLITVIPEADASLTDTYTLKVSADSVTVILADNVQINDIPAQPYIIRSTETEIIPVIPATIDFDPNTLNLRSKGQWVTVYIELPQGHGYDVSQIDLGSVILNGQVQAETKPTEIGDYDNDGIPDLMVKFSRVTVQSILDVGDEVGITIIGQLIDERLFEGSDTIGVTVKGK